MKSLSSRSVGDNDNDGVKMKFQIKRIPVTTNYDAMFKIILVGDDGVGKTSILDRFSTNIFDPEMSYSPTIGIDLYSIYMRLRCTFTSDITREYKYQIWDCAGNTNYNQLITSYCRNAHVVLFVFDVSNRKSYESIRQWQQLVMDVQTDVDPIYLLVGNKSDHVNKDITTNEGNELAESLGMKYIETSAKTSKGIKKLFKEISRLCYFKYPNLINEHGQSEEKTNKCYIQ